MQSMSKTVTRNIRTHEKTGGKFIRPLYGMIFGAFATFYFIGTDARISIAESGHAKGLRTGERISVRLDIGARY
jgi:hypothetical protein